MGMISDILVNAKARAIRVHEKANDVCDISKLRFFKKRVKREVYKSYTLLGRKYYAMSKKGELDTADFSSELEHIEELHLQYESLSLQLEELKAKQYCDVCEHDCDCDMENCPCCGNELD